MREDPALRAPWGGIFEPWRPFVLIAIAASECADRGQQKRRRPRARQLRVLPGQLALNFRGGDLLGDDGAIAISNPVRPVTPDDPITDEDVPF